MKVALVYDWVDKFGGAERVLQALHEIYPEAPLFTSVFNLEKAPWAKDFKVIPSFLNKLPLANVYHEFYPWLMPLAFESFDFSDFDLVISVTSAQGKGIITKPSTYHLCYCLTPTRYLFSSHDQYFKNKFLKFLVSPVLNYLLNWDKVAAQRPDRYVAISENVRKRIKKYYYRDSDLIYPPVDLKKFYPDKNKKGDYFLVVSRLVPYKKVDLVVQAFNSLGLPLKIVGVGSQLGSLRRQANNNVEFLGQLTDKRLLSYYQNCRAVIFPTDEDFGLVPLEAQACGKPVIAFGAGGALETVKQGITGTFFYPQTAEALVKEIKKFKPEIYKSENCCQNAENFSQDNFKKNFKDLVKKVEFGKF